MTGRRILTPALSILAAVLCGVAFSSIALADEASVGSKRAEAAASPKAAETAVSPEGSPGLCQEEIFEILKGGGALSDPGLLEHLWRVAGSLACRDWTPPAVTIRVVVASPTPTGH